MDKCPENSYTHYVQLNFMNNRLIYLPFGLIAIIFLILLLWISVTVLFFGALSTTFTKMGFSWSYAMILLLASLVGAGINVPLATVRSKVPVVRERSVRFFGMSYRIPMVEEMVNNTTIAINVGGAVIPMLVSAYLIGKFPQVFPFALAGTIIVALVTHAVARPIRGVGIATPIFVPPLTAALGAILLTSIFCPHAHECLFSTAYIGGVMGTLIGADLLNLNRIADLGAPVASIGGAGTFDGIFLSGVIAVLIV